MSKANSSPGAESSARNAPSQTAPAQTKKAQTRPAERRRTAPRTQYGERPTDEEVAEIGIELGPRDGRIVGTPARSVGFTLSSLGHAVAREFRNELQIVAMEPREFALLRAIAPDEGISQQALAERVGIQPSRVVTMVDALEQSGLIERHANPDDRRARELYMTDKGRIALKNAFKLASELERRLCARLSQSEREQLLEMLHGIERQLELAPGIHAAGVEMGRPNSGEIGSQAPGPPPPGPPEPAAQGNRSSHGL
jgi:DNA-binding MarR family transcriptional regulator